MVVAPGVTTAVPEVPDGVKLPPVQDVALVELQDRVDDCPALMEVGLAESETVGGGDEAATETVAVAVADPTLAEQVIE